MARIPDDQLDRLKQEVRSGPRKLDSLISEIFRGFQAANELTS